MPLEGATGVFVKDMVLVCGGSNDEDYQDECHTLHKGKTKFEFYKKLQDNRTLASSTVVQENMWITGGFNETNSFFYVFFLVYEVGEINESHVKLTFQYIVGES